MSLLNTENNKFYRHCTGAAICLFLVIVTFSVYYQVTDFEFVNYDDTAFVTENFHVRNGLTRTGIEYVFSNPSYIGMQLSVLSHMFDCELYGLTPGGHHLTNLILHLFNSVLIFIVFQQMTGAQWKSAFVAALFALHPLNVESVAWISERRNVLSTLFWLLTIITYVRYIRRPGTISYAPVLLCFTLGIMSKAMLVTLPFVLFLLDYWPLHRLHLFSKPPEGSAKIKIPERTLLQIILEKIPLIAIAIVISLLTISIGNDPGGIFGGEALASAEALPINLRIQNAITSYAGYLAKMTYPSGLSALYLHPTTHALGKVVFSGFLILSISIFTIIFAKKTPYLPVGWFWYLGTLVPVIGIIQIGAQSMADRYAYISLIGIFMIVAWGVPDLLKRWPHREKWLAALSVATLLFLMPITWKQTGYWKNSTRLFERVIEVSPDNYLAHTYLGNVFNQKGNTEKAIRHYLYALRLKPNFANAHNALGIALYKQGRLNDAMDSYSKALAIKPGYADAHYNMGMALLQKGDIDGAIFRFQQALKINPNHPMIKNTLNKLIRLKQQRKT